MKSTPYALCELHGKVKSQLPANTLLAFELGDFDEFFGGDAESAARILNIALTHHYGTPMAGYPKHARGRYFKKLSIAGFKLAVVNP